MRVSEWLKAFASGGTFQSQYYHECLKDDPSIALEGIILQAEALEADKARLDALESDLIEARRTVEIEAEGGPGDRWQPYPVYMFEVQMGDKPPAEAPTLRQAIDDAMEGD